MATFLFDQIIFGPVQSRRLGKSLGINLLPITRKICNFNCIYCECGLNDLSLSDTFPPQELIISELEKTLRKMKADNNLPDAITYAGNGEPTLHPAFAEITHKTIELRNEIAPQCKIVVISNATMLHITSVVEALKAVDQALLKIDSAIEETQITLNQPKKYISPEDLAPLMKQLGEKLIIQTMFVRGSINNMSIDNTTTTELNALIEFYKATQPSHIFIYSIARDTPIDTLQIVKKDELEQIANTISNHGFSVNVN